jgi:hypothetical protein
MSRLYTSLSIAKRPRLLVATGWVLWAMFVALWAVSLVPFYTKGLHLASDISLEYAGGGYARFNIPNAPTFEDVYGVSTIASIAQSVVCFGPGIFVLAFGSMLWKVLTSLRSYTRTGIVLRITALLMTFILIALSFNMAGKFLIWGAG